MCRPCEKVFKINEPIFPALWRYKITIFWAVSKDIFSFWLIDYLSSFNYEYLLILHNRWQPYPTLPNQQYLLEILSISLWSNNGAEPHSFENKGIVGNVWIDEELFIDNQTKIHLWEHQKGLVGEYLQIYTVEDSSKVDWSTDWSKSIGKLITWFYSIKKKHPHSRSTIHRYKHIIFKSFKKLQSNILS